MTTRPSELRLDLTAYNGSSVFIVFQNFSIGPPPEYRMHFTPGGDGTAGILPPYCYFFVLCCIHLFLSSTCIYKFYRSVHVRTFYFLHFRSFKLQLHVIDLLQVMLGVV